MFVVFTLINFLTQGGNRDFYSILNVMHDASHREIQKSFMKLSRQYHPDKNKGVVEERFTDINDAYAVLRDDNKRRIYDIYGEKGVHLYEAPKNQDAFLNPLGNAGETDPLAAAVRRVGLTNKIRFPVDLLDFYKGHIYPLLTTRRTICRCPHQGFKCDRCRGRPTIRENVNLSLIVEIGSDDNSIVPFKGAGDVSEINGPGDIEVTVYAKKHPIFTRKGSDLLMKINVTLKEALLGFKKEFIHLDGTTKFFVEQGPAEVGNHTVVVKNMGMPKYLAPGEYGDIIAQLNILQPKHLNAEQKIQLSDALRE